MAARGRARGRGIFMDSDEEDEPARTSPPVQQVRQISLDELAQRYGDSPPAPPSVSKAVAQDEDEDDDFPRPVGRGRGGRGRGRFSPSHDDDEVAPSTVPMEVEELKDRYEETLAEEVETEVIEEVVPAPPAAAVALAEDEDTTVNVPTTSASGSAQPTSRASDSEGVQSIAGTTAPSVSASATASHFPSTVPPSQWSDGVHAQTEEPVTKEPSPPSVAEPTATGSSPRSEESAKPKRVRIVQRGAKGELIPVATNFMRLNFLHGSKIHEYHVEFKPPMDSTRMKRKTLHMIFGTDKTYNFDGMILFLPEKIEGTTEYEGLHPVTKEPVVALTRYIKEKKAYDLVQFFNILFKRIMRVLERVELRRCYFDTKNIKNLDQHKMEVWPGHCISVDEQEGGLMLCLDISHRVLRKDTVYDQYNSMKGITGDWKNKFTEFMAGKIVLTKYNNTCYKIDDVDYTKSPMSTFMKRGQEITFLEYYREHYGLTIVNTDQPLILSRIKPRRTDVDQEEKIVALVPELCNITGLTDDQRSNFTVMKDLGEHTRLLPSQRKIVLEKFIAEVNKHPEAKKVLAQWNMEMEDRPVQIEARMMSGPTLNFGKRDVNVGADFSRDAMNSVCNPQNIEKYLVICTVRDADKAKRFVDTYKQCATQLGIQTLGAPTILPIKGYQVNDFRKAIKENMTDQFQFLLCMMPQQRDDVYNVIKKMCVSELEVPSQCVLMKTLNNEKKFRPVIQKIALQINCKLGGSLWALRIPVTNPIMFVGIDVCHDALKKNPSVLGLVATLNNECTKYISYCRIMKVHQEAADQLRSAFSDALDVFQKENGQFPGRLVVWRDGGLSDPASFNEHEVQQFEKVLKEKCPTTKFSYVVIQKRISQRFFKTDRMGKNWANPDPGTVIDHTVTRYDVYDFYVVSQLVRQGTVSPTHYVVVKDNAETKPDLIQKFAYVCSFMYYNWPGTVRVPAMVQYAHKLAALVGQNVRAPPGNSLERTLYYL